MIISIASGKGGTGKTTVATNLALSIDSDVMLLDFEYERQSEAGETVKQIWEKTAKVLGI